MELKNKTYLEVQEYLKTSQSILLPYGATEHHGPSCSIGTDTLLAGQIATEVGKELEILVSPTIPIGVSPQQMALPGTITLRPETLASIFSDQIRSLYEHGFRKFFVINSHFENNHCLTGEIGTVIQTYHDVLVYMKDFWDLPKVRALIRELLDEEGGHADATDISLMMHIAPDQVHKDELVEEWPKINAWVSNVLHQKWISATGVIGSDQKKATPEIGKTLYEAIIEGYSSEIKKLINIDI